MTTTQGEGFSMTDGTKDHELSSTLDAIVEELKELDGEEWPFGVVDYSEVFTNKEFSEGIDGLITSFVDLSLIFETTFGFNPANQHNPVFGPEIRKEMAERLDEARLMFSGEDASFSAIKQIVDFHSLYLPDLITYLVSYLITKDKPHGTAGPVE